MLLRAPPAPFPQPEWMPAVQRTPRPVGVDETVVQVLLRLLDDAVQIVRRIVLELAESFCVRSNQSFVTGTNRRAHVREHESDSSFLVVVNNRHAQIIAFSLP